MEDSSELKIKINTFPELKQFCADNKDRIATSITKCQAMRICEESSGFGQEIFSLWVRELLDAYSKTGNFSEAANWQQLMALFNKALEDALTTVKTEELNCLLCDTLAFVEWSDKLYSLHICILEFILNTLTKILDIVWKLNDDSDLKEKSSSVYSSLLKIINRNTFLIDNRGEFSRLNEVILKLCDIAEQPRALDIKNVIDTWKCITKLVKYCAKTSYFETTTSADSWHHYALVKRPIHFLFQEITRHVTVVYQENTMNEPEVKIIKYLKVTNFYIELLCNLMSTFRNTLSPTIDLLNALSVALCMPNNLRNTYIADVLDRYVRKSLYEVFYMVYKHVDMPNLLLFYMDTSKWETYFVVVKLYLKAVIQEQDIEFIDIHAKNYFAIFEKLFTDSSVFINNPNEYNEVIELFAALTILNAKLKRFFMQNIYKVEFITAQASVDVLLVVSRYATKYKIISSKQILKDYNFWSQCNDSFAVFSNNINSLHVQVMLVHYFALCAANDKIEGDAFCPQNRQICVETNFRFLISVGLTQICKKNSIELHCRNLIDEAFKFLKDLDMHPTKECYYKMLTRIMIVAESRILSPKEELLQQLFEFIVKRLKSSNGSAAKFALLINTALNLVITYISDISKNLLHYIFQHVKNILDTHVHLVTVSTVHFLNVCAEYVEATRQQFVRSIVNNMTSRKSFKIINFILFDTANCSYSSCELNTKLYDTLALTNNKNNAHVCVNCGELQHKPSPKRLKMDVDMDDSGNGNDENASEKCNLKYAINEVSVNCNKILKLCKHADVEDNARLNAIVNSLQSVITK